MRRSYLALGLLCAACQATSSAAPIRKSLEAHRTLTRAAVQEAIAALHDAPAPCTYWQVSAEFNPVDASLLAIRDQASGQASAVHAALACKEEDTDAVPMLVLEASAVDKVSARVSHRAPGLDEAWVDAAMTVTIAALADALQWPESYTLDVNASPAANWQVPAGPELDLPSVLNMSPSGTLGDLLRGEAQKHPGCRGEVDAKGLETIRVAMQTRLSHPHGFLQYKVSCGDPAQHADTEAQPRPAPSFDLVVARSTPFRHYFRSEGTLTSPKLLKQREVQPLLECVVFSHLRVDPRHLGQGIGSRWGALLGQQLLKRGATCLLVQDGHVTTKTSGPHLYARLGYTEPVSVPNPDEADEPFELLRYTHPETPPQ